MIRKNIPDTGKVGESQAKKKSVKIDLPVLEQSPMYSQGLPVYLRLRDLDNKTKEKFSAYKSGESSKGLSMILRINTPQTRNC